MSHRTITLRDIRGILWWHRWVLAGVVMLGAIAGGLWYALSPHAFEASYLIPVGLEGSGEQQWDTLRTDAVYFSLLRMAQSDPILQAIDTINSERESLDGQQTDGRKLMVELQRDTFRLMVIDIDADSASALARDWAQKVYDDWQQRADEAGLTKENQTELGECFISGEGDALVCTPEGENEQPLPAGAESSAGTWFAAIRVGEPVEQSVRQVSPTVVEAILAGMACALFAGLMMILVKISTGRQKP